MISCKDSIKTVLFLAICYFICLIRNQVPYRIVQKKQIGQNQMRQQTTRRAQESIPINNRFSWLPSIVGDINDSMLMDDITGSIVDITVDANIPEQFRLDDLQLLSQNIVRRPMPRWDIVDNVMNDITVMDSTLDFLTKLESMYELETTRESCRMANVWDLSVHTENHYHDVMWFNPEILYVVDGASNSKREGIIWVSSSASNCHFCIERVVKIENTEPAMQLAYNILRMEDKSVVEHRWPRIHHLLLEQEGGSFPFVAWYGDYTGCNSNNWNGGTETVPLFTVAANIKCNQVLPFPNYAVWSASTDNSEEITNRVERLRSKYPVWNDKIPKVVWRGGLTGFLINEDDQGPRYHLNKLVHSETAMTVEERELFDVKIVEIPDGSPAALINITELGGVHEFDRIQQEDFQNYRAILDVDGNSWSSRFASLLCYSSIVLKVEPQEVDYFHYKHYDDENNEDDTKLLPWKHFIPVRADFSDLVEKVKYAIDDKNQHQVERTIQNANRWCINSLLRDEVARDVLDVWEFYITNILDKTDYNWESKWNQAKQGYMEGALEMIPI
jgi:Glycosyl transferase family 90